MTDGARQRTERDGGWAAGAVRIFGRSAASAMGIAAVAAAVVAASVLVPARATAAACAAPFRYSASTDTLYVAGASVTLTDIAEQCPAAPLQLVDSSTATWELRSDLVLQQGATLRLHSTAGGGDVNMLRLQSLSSAAKTDVASITAQYGVIDMSGVTVTSWDAAAGGPDTTTGIPSGAPAGARGRAFIRALSVLDPSGNPQTSRMNVVDSDLGYLGYNAPESYGVAYKARGCDISHPEICDKLDVTGVQRNSKFHHNYMGTYTWGAYGISFTGNEYYNNISYGLDPHDDSDHLTVDGNFFHDNGNHGFICSQRCDHLTVTNNRSYDNGHVPYVGPADDDPTDNQVHGIMLHRGVTDTLVANNDVRGNINGAGIAIFDSSGDTIRGNSLSNNKFGIRLSVGARDLAVSDNTVTDSGSYAVYTYKGSDAAAYTNASGRTSDVMFTGNTITGSGSNVIKLGDSDRFTFQNNTVGGTLAAGPRVERTADFEWNGANGLASGTTFVFRGTAASPTTARFVNVDPSTVTVSKDGYSTVTFSAG